MKHRIAAAIRGEISPIIQLKIQATPRTSTAPSLQVSGEKRHQQKRLPSKTPLSNGVRLMKDLGLSTLNLEALNIDQRLTLIWIFCLNIY